MAKDRLARGDYWRQNWGVVYGCTKVATGCKNCWAEANHNRWHSAANPPAVYQAPFSQVRVFPERLDIPLQVKKPTVFVANFSGDTFHEKVPRRTILGIWRVMEVCPQHTFIVLTKRWTRMYGLVRDLFEGRRGFPLSNVWLGVSVSTQAELNAAEPYLLKTPAVVRFLSLEPLLGPVDLVGVRRAFIAEACGCTEIDVASPVRTGDHARSSMLRASSPSAKRPVCPFS
ncbi:MAG: DUF5131 family protein [Planctomycetota bacterium]